MSGFGIGANKGVEQLRVVVYPVISAAVGGVVTPVNKFKMLTPYLALAGLVTTIMAVFTIKKRRRKTSPYLSRVF